MSLVRLSCLRGVPYAPDADGDFVHGDYRKTTKRGRMESVAKDTELREVPGLRHYLEAMVRPATKHLEPGEPVVVLVHGFLFDPKDAMSADPKDTDNPHGRIFHQVNGDEGDEQRHHTTSWPLHLGFKKTHRTGKSGLALCFGWHSKPGIASSLLTRFQNYYSRAYDYAGETAEVLVRTIEILGKLVPDHPIDIFTHSLGTRVVVRAIASAAKRRPRVVKRLGRVLMLGGAEYVVEAQLMMKRLQDLSAPSRPAFYNFVSRENDVLDKLAENFGPTTFGNSQVIGHNGLDSFCPCEEWIDLQIDDGDLQGWLARNRRLEISGDRPGNIWDHWYYFTFRGNMRLYREILRDRERWSIAELRRLDPTIPEGVTRGWFSFGD